MSSLEAGQRIGRYELTAQLGEGSFAEVWQARQYSGLEFSRQVAVKILKPGRESDPRHLRDLITEATLCAELRHPNIVQVDDVEQSGDTVLVAMELVTGGTVLDLLRTLRSAGLRMPTSAVLDLGIQLCHGLDHAWNGVRDSGEPFHLVHRDLKPANLLLTQHGELRIADFGIAKRLGDPTVTTTGSLRGTPCYVAPELLRGERLFTPRVDLFAVGCILWELWRGEVLFSADSIAGVVARILIGSPQEDVAECTREFPELGALMVRLLSRDPELRPNSAAAVRDQLMELRAQAGVVPDLSLLQRLARDLKAGETVALGSPPAMTSDWAAVWRAVDPTAPLPTTAVSAPPLATTGAVQVPAAVSKPTPVAKAAPVAKTAPVAQAARTPRKRRRSPPPPNRWPLAAALVGVAVLGFGVVFLASTDDSSADASDLDAASAIPADVLPDEGGVPDLAAPTPAPVRRPTPPAPAAARPQAQDPTPAPREPARPTPTPAEPTPAPVEPTPTDSTPAPIAARQPEPSQPPAKGCLLLRSAPPGATVFLNATQRGNAGGSSTDVRMPLAAGSYVLGMGMFGKPAASVGVEVRSGETQRVTCTTGSAAACRVERLVGVDCG